MTRVRLFFLPVAALLCLPWAGPAGAADEQTEADARLLKAAGVTDGPSLVAFLRRRSPGGQEPGELEALVRQLGSESFEERERAPREVVGFGAAALPLLE